MQLFALDKSGVCLPADEAAKQWDYYCLECGSVVRLRGGFHRRNHFYHLQADRACRQNGKSLTHLQVQCAIRDLLPAGECELERKFREIGRIADVAWECRKIIFEVQCSDITAAEIEARNRDYGSLGYEVVWILHDNRYNRWRMSAAEYVLLGSTHYFTNIGIEGRGIIYDQHTAFRHGIKHERTPVFPIDVSRPLHLVSANKQPPFFLHQRLKKWSLHFAGDLLDIYLNDENNFLDRCADISAAVEEYVVDNSAKFACGWLRKAVKQACGFYAVFLRYLVERACR